MRWIRLSLIPLLTSTTAFAVSTGTGPVDLVRNATEGVVAQLAEAPEIKSEPDKLTQLVEEHILPSIDFSRLSRLTLGKYWRTANDRQRMRFTDEFKELLVRTYSTALTEYSGQAITYTPVKTTADGNRSIVRTAFQQPAGGSVRVDYSLYKVSGGWKIYDVKIEGISLAVNYRSSFAQAIRSHGLDGLIEHLATRNRLN